jgi:hypothetical protein
MGAGGSYKSGFSIGMNNQLLQTCYAHVRLRKNYVRLTANLKAGENTLLIRLNEAGESGGIVVTCRGEDLSIRPPAGLK